MDNDRLKAKEIAAQENREAFYAARRLVRHLQKVKGDKCVIPLAFSEGEYDVIVQKKGK